MDDIVSTKKEVGAENRTEHKGGGQGFSMLIYMLKAQSDEAKGSPTTEFFESTATVADLVGRLEGLGHVSYVGERISSTPPPPGCPLYSPLQHTHPLRMIVEHPGEPYRRIYLRVTGTRKKNETTPSKELALLRTMYTSLLMKYNTLEAERSGTFASSMPLSPATAPSPSSSSMSSSSSSASPLSLSGSHSSSASSPSPFNTASPVRQMGPLTSPTSSPTAIHHSSGDTYNTQADNIAGVGPHARGGISRNPPSPATPPAASPAISSSSSLPSTMPLSSSSQMIAINAITAQLRSTVIPTLPAKVLDGCTDILAEALQQIQMLITNNR